MATQAVFHGILIDKAFHERALPEGFHVFARQYCPKLDWNLYGVEIDRAKLDVAVQRIQDGMKDESPYYTHFYDGERIVVVFKDRVFNVSREREGWEPILVFGASCGILIEQLDFYPNSFEQELEYFEPGEFI